MCIRDRERDVVARFAHGFYGILRCCLVTVFLCAVVIICAAGGRGCIDACRKNRYAHLFLLYVCIFMYSANTEVHGFVQVHGPV